MIKAVIFDMDGLLVDSEPLWKRTVAKAYKRIGIDITSVHHREMAGRTTLENAEYFYSRHPWQGPTPQELADSIINDMLVLMKSESRLMPGVHHALQACKKASLPVAIASSSPMLLIDAVVDALKLREHFSHIYSAQFEPHGKPHPGVFLKVAGHFGVAPRDCLVFEDSPAGVLAAKAAGMKCVAVPHPADKDNPFIRTADIIIDSLEEFNAKTLRDLGT
jgi:sugar-phosphatase